MPTNINPAYRLHQIISVAANSHQDNQRTLDVWTQLFQLTDVEMPQRDFQAIEGLRLLVHELEMTRSLMAATNITEALFRPSLDSIQNALNIALLSATWNSVRGQLGPQVVNDIRWCSEVLPNEESLISTDELNDLLTDIADLEESVKSTSLSEHFKKLILRHIAAIRHAVRWYPITGKKGLDTQIHTAYGELKSYEGTPEPSSNNDHSKKRFLQAWSKFMAIAKKAAGAADTAERITALASKGKRLLELFETFTSSGSSGGPMPPPGTIA